MFPIERKEQIKSMVYEKKTVAVSELSELFSVSPETIRRDLDALEQEGTVVKTYGGASLADRVTTHVSTRILSSILVENKNIIAREAAKQIHKDDCIFLDHSTTVFSLCPLIKDLPLTVMTNSLNVINYLKDYSNIHLVCVGGTYFDHSCAFFGIEAAKSLTKYNLDKAFISCRSLDLVKGISDFDEQTANMRKSIIVNSYRSYLLVDHTKFNKKAFISICPLTDIHHIITDTGLDASWKNYLNKNHIQYCECSSDAADNKEADV